MFPAGYTRRDYCLRLGESFTDKPGHLARFDSGETGGVTEALARCMVMVHAIAPNADHAVGRPARQPALVSALFPKERDDGEAERHCQVHGAGVWPDVQPAAVQRCGELGNAEVLGQQLQAGIG